MANLWTLPNRTLFGYHNTALQHPVKARYLECRAQQKQHVTTVGAASVVTCSLARRRKEPRQDLMRVLPEVMKGWTHAMASEENLVRNKAHRTIVARTSVERVPQQLMVPFAGMPGTMLPQGWDTTCITPGGDFEDGC
eukprot:6472516-Amphidinium_carterae.1